MGFLSDFVDWLSGTDQWVKENIPEAGEKKDIYHRPVTTKRGKVVYKRKKHTMTIDDAFRIWIRTTKAYSVHLIFQSLTIFSLAMIQWIIVMFPKTSLVNIIKGEVYDYLARFLDGIRVLLQQAGWAMDEIPSEEDRDLSREKEGFILD